MGRINLYCKWLPCVLWTWSCKSAGCYAVEE
jgi:hypothetical protein